VSRRTRRRHVHGRFNTLESNSDDIDEMLPIVTMKLDVKSRENQGERGPMMLQFSEELLSKRIELSEKVALVC
jgi:hypothetical protein